MDERLLICMVGLPQSGKTTWAKARGFPVVCPDSIRLALHGQRYERLAEPMVWAIAKVMVRALFLAGHNTVILDSTNTTRKHRDEWQDDLWHAAFCVIDTAPHICMERADEALFPVIERMADQWECLGDDETPYDQGPLPCAAP